FWLQAFDVDLSGVIPSFPKTFESVIQLRIGELKFGHDLWYEVDSQRTAYNLIRTISKDIEDYILPFLDQFETTDHIIQYLEKHKTIYGNDYKLFILLAEEGLKDQAQIQLNQLIKNSPENIPTLRVKEISFFVFRRLFWTFTVCPIAPRDLK
ncbi:MAG: hypothetical protein AAFV80_13050, partial [Bacteroidota bacterium]